MTDILDRLVHRTTRQRAAETLWIAHALIDPSLADSQRPFRLSPTAATLLEIVFEGVHTARADLVTHVLVSLRFARHLRHEDDEPRWHHLLNCAGETTATAVVRFARDVAGLSLQDIGAAGSAATVLSLLTERPSPRRKVA